jgi:hypothetical protein
VDECWQRGKAKRPADVRDAPTDMSLPGRGAGVKVRVWAETGGTGISPNQREDEMRLTPITKEEELTSWLIEGSGQTDQHCIVLIARAVL